MNPNTVAAMYDLPRIHRDECIQKILAVLSYISTDRSHIARETRINPDNLAWRLKELKEAGIIEPCGTCLSTTRRKATKIKLADPPSRGGGGYKKNSVYITPINVT